MLACACATPPKRADPQAKPSKGLALLLPFARLGRLVPPHSRSHGGSDIQRHQRNPEMSPSSFSLFGSRIEALTFHPFEANSFAVARPKPEEAPVMKIALWSWLLIDASNSNGMIRPMLRWYKANCHDSPTNGAWHLAKNRSEIGEEGG